MGNIVPFLKRDGAVFGPQDIQAMSMALDDISERLDLGGQSAAREIIAIRIIELARRGELSPTRLRDCLLAEVNGGSGC